MNHHCHAKHCKVEVPPKMLMCYKHWKLVPQPLQSAVWEHYQRGQEERMVAPTSEWHEAADAAIDHVYQLELKKGMHVQGRLI